MLAAYENIEQGLASRIVTMAEQEQAHRHKNEDRALTAQIDDVKDERRAEQRGQWFAFLVVIAILLASGYMTHAGFANAGAWLAGATLAACAAVFITRKRGSNEQEIVQEQPSSSNKKRKN